MSKDEVLTIHGELDEANRHRDQLMRQVDELQKVAIAREEQVQEAEETIQRYKDRIKFLEGQVAAYQYCLNCRR